MSSIQNVAIYYEHSQGLKTEFMPQRGGSKALDFTTGKQKPLPRGFAPTRQPTNFLAHAQILPYRGSFLYYVRIDMSLNPVPDNDEG